MSPNPGVDLATPASTVRNESGRGSTPVRVLVFMEAREFGGPAKNLVDTANLLSGHVEYRVVTFIRGGAKSTEFTERMAAADVPYSIIHERFRYDPRAIVALRRIVRSFQPDVVQIHNNKSRFYMYLLRSSRLLGGFATIDCYHGETWTDRKQLAYNRLDRWLFRKADNVIVVSRTQEELLASYGVDRERITVVYNGIRLKPSVFKPAIDTLDIVCIGRMSREKGHTVLIDAVEELQRRRVGRFTVTLVGDGPEAATLRSRVESAQLTDTVRFAGYQNDPTSYYENANLFVLPSLSEGIPNVLLEAGMYHVPIVTTPVGGIREMFDEGTEAVFVEPGDATALADGLERCLTDATLRENLAVAARSRIERDFTQEVRAERYLNYYRNLLKKSS